MKISRALIFPLLIAATLANAALAQPPVRETPRAEATVDAARAAELEQALAADQQELDKLKDDLAQRQQEYDAAIKEWNQLQSDLAAQKKDLEAEPEDVAALEEKLRLAQERVDLSIADRKATQALLARLNEKIAQDKLALRRALGEDEPAVTPTAPTSTTPAAPTDPTSTPSLLPAAPTAPPSERVAAAENEATQKQAAADKAQRSVAELQARQQLTRESIDLEKQRLASAYKRHDNLSQTLRPLEEELYRELNAGKEFSELGELSKKLDETRQSMQAVSREILERSQRIDELQAQLAGLQLEELEQAREASQRAAEAEEATRQKWLVTIYDYAITALPRVAVLVVVIVLLQWLLRLVSKRLISVWVNRGRGTEDERLNRAKTLAGVFDNAAATFLYVGGTLLVLDTLRVPIATLLGGVAVAGLAVAFGAQNLIRDYFTGFMILLENQYKISDVVTINGNTGTVERITLRLTVLRDFEGKVYFIPNGQINMVINLTHEWSRVVLDIGVAYKEQVEKVMSVLLELGEAMYHEPGFAGAILQEPELLGVERLDDSAVIIRLCLVTRPDKKWPVKREMQRRIKSRFDELGIEIPFPQRTIHVRSEPPTEPAPTMPAPAPAAQFHGNGAQEEA